MSRPRNVVNFPSDKQGDSGLKGFAMLFYLFVAFMLTVVANLSDGGLGILLALGLLYNYGVRQGIHKKTGYLKENRILLIILLVVSFILYPLSTGLIIGISAIYWLLVGRSGREAPYFLKFHMLTALIFNFFLLMPFLILTSLILVASRALALVQMNAAALVIGSISQTYLPLMMMGLLWGAALWLSISVMMGRTPYIGVVTNSVRSLT